MAEEHAKTLLVIGGTRSGKSGYAQQQAEQNPGECVYIATGQAFDAEMTDRIARHRAARGSRWRTVEAPLDLAAAITRESCAGSVVLVDCLTLWLSNLMADGREIPAEIDALTLAIGRAPSPLILVSSEVGQGIVPDNALARQFRDLAGQVNQAVGQAVGRAVMVVAGFPLVLK